MEGAWEACLQQPEAKTPERILEKHFDFSEYEARNLQAKRGWTLEQLRDWHWFKELAYKAQGITCPIGLVKWAMRNHDHPGQARQPWWHPKGQEPKEGKVQEYDKPYQRPEPQEVMSWEEVKKRKDLPKFLQKILERKDATEGPFV